MLPLFCPPALEGSVRSGTWHLSHGSNAQPEEYGMAQGSPASGWWVQTNELGRLARTPNHSLPGKKLGLLEQPWMSVWVSDTLARFGLAINGDSSRDLTIAGSLHSWAWHFAVVRPSFRAAAPVSGQLSEVSQFYLHSLPCANFPRLVARKIFDQWPFSSRWC